MVDLLVTTLVTIPTTTSATLATPTSITPCIPFYFFYHMRTIVFVDGGISQLMLLTLYDYYFHLPSAKNLVDVDFGYTLIFHNNYIPLDVISPSYSLMCFNDDCETN